MFNLFISRKSLRNIIHSANKRGHDDALETLVPAALTAAFERDGALGEIKVLETHIGLLEAHCLDLEALASDLEEKLVAAKEPCRRVHPTSFTGVTMDVNSLYPYQFTTYAQRKGKMAGAEFLAANAAFAAQVENGAPNPSPTIDYCVMVRCEEAGASDWYAISPDVSLQQAVDIIVRTTRDTTCQGCEYKIEAH